MKTKYKHIEFNEVTYNSWTCFNRHYEELIGWVRYYDEWRQFVFSADSAYADFSKSCLEDIAHFLSQLNKTKGCYKSKGELK